MQADYFGDCPRCQKAGARFSVHKEKFVRCDACRVYWRGSHEKGPHGCSAHLAYMLPDYEQVEPAGLSSFELP
jgi:hypothetical protein